MRVTDGRVYLGLCSRETRVHHGGEGQKETVAVAVAQEAERSHKQQKELLKMAKPLHCLNLPLVTFSPNEAMPSYRTPLTEDQICEPGRAGGSISPSNHHTFTPPTVNGSGIKWVSHAYHRNSHHEGRAF